MATDVNAVFMRMTARRLDDIERERKAAENRKRALTRSEVDSDGLLRGLGLPEDHPEVQVLQEDLDVLDQREQATIKHMVKLYKRHHLYSYTKGIKGVGEKTIVRLLGTIGDPYLCEYDVLNDEGKVVQPEGPRSLKQLYAYMGLTPFHGKKTGQNHSYSHEAKTRAWLIVESCMKQLCKDCKDTKDEVTGAVTHVETCSCSPYRVILDQRRAYTAQTHPEWTPMHSLRDAQRYASKHLVKDLYFASKEYHTQ